MERKPDEQNPDVKTPGRQEPEVKEPQARPGGDDDVEKGPGPERHDQDPQEDDDDKA